MLTKRELNLSKIMVAMQVIVSVLLFVGVEYVHPIPGEHLSRQVFFISQIILIWSFLFTKFHLGIIFREKSFGSMIRGYFVTISIGGILLILELLAIHLYYVSHRYTISYILIFCGIDLVVLIGFKYFIYNTMRLMRRSGWNSRHVIIVADDHAMPFIDSFLKAKDWGYILAAIASPDEKVKEKYPDLTIIQTQEELQRYFTLHAVDDIFYCMSVNDPRYNLAELINDTELIGVSLHIMQENVIENELGEKSFSLKNAKSGFITYKKGPKRYISLKLKDLLDILFSALVIVIFSPVYILIAILIKMEDGGSIFFKQQRIGLNGRRFYCFKFRSMIVNAEAKLAELKDLNESDGPTFKIENDPRITKIGRFLRKTSLDELPQFYNVIKGEMSIVGPRPPLFSEVVQYERSQLRRLSMKPGITCIWQVKGRNVVSFQEWMRMDLEYIDNWSIWLDIKLMAATLGVILKANGR